MEITLTYTKKSRLVKALLNIILLVFIFGCSSGRQSFEKGDYDRAVFQAVNRLQKDPDNTKAIVTLKKAFSFASEDHITQIEEAIKSQDAFRYEAVVLEYERLNILIEAIRKCPSCREVVKTDGKYMEPLAAAREKAAESRYQAGIKLLGENNRVSAREAYAHFERADHFFSGYKDSRQKLDDAYQAALLKVVVEPVEINHTTYKLSNEYFQNKIVEYLQRYETKSFVKFYTPREAKSDRLVPDQVVSLQFDDFVVGQTYLKEKEKEITKDSVITGTLDGKNVYGTVKAKYITFEKTITSSGLLDFRVLDWKTKSIITQEKFPGTFVWQDGWATYKGDERALTKEHKKMVNRRPGPDPSPQFLFVEFTKPIYNQLTGKIERFYKDFRL